MGPLLVFQTIVYCREANAPPISPLGNPNFPYDLLPIASQLMQKDTIRFDSILVGFNGWKKMCWVSWEKLTKPKSAGGLGFKDIQRFNTTLLAKIPWIMLTNPDCLLARVMLGKYCQNDNILRVKPSTSISHGWRGILAGRDLLVEHLGKLIGDGTTIKVWG